MTFQVNEYGAVAPAAAPRPVVHPEHARGPRRRFRRPAPEHAQQRGGAHRHRQADRQARSRSRPQGEADVALDVGQAPRAARPRPGDLGQAFGEDPTRAVARGAPEPTHLDAQGGDAPLPGQVGQDAVVAAMHPAGGVAARRAAAHRRLRSGEDDNAVGLGQDLLNQQACRDQRQKAAGQLSTE